MYLLGGHYDIFGNNTCILLYFFSSKMNNARWLISRLPHRCFTTVTGSSPQVQQPLNFVNGQRSNPVDGSNTEVLNLIAPATGNGIVYLLVPCVKLLPLRKLSW